MSEQKPIIEPKNFIEAYVLELLKNFGFDKMTPADQKGYFVQFLAEGERRIGLALAPYFDSDQKAEEFSKMMQDDKNPDEWLKFWENKVPNFQEVVKQALDKYAQELATAFKM